MNAKKYLDAKVEGGSARGGHANNMYVAIYGACNSAGKAYSEYLIEKGFNLILIDADLVVNSNGSMSSSDSHLAE